MRAILLEKFGGLDSLVYTDISKPLPGDGEVVIKVRAFGVDHAEAHIRRGERAEAAEVSGIECVGTVDACPSSEFPVGAKAAALSRTARDVCGPHGLACFAISNFPRARPS
jgi:NADPH2:quinone reductase